MKRLSLCGAVLCALIAPTAQARTPTLAQALEGTVWRWDSYALEHVLPGQKLSRVTTLHFRRGSAGWSSGCNGGGGEVEWKELGRAAWKQTVLRVPQVVSTAKACANVVMAPEIALSGWMQHGVQVQLERKVGKPVRLTLRPYKLPGLLTFVPHPK